MGFKPNITPVEVTKIRVFEETYFREFYTVINDKNSIENHRKNLMS